MLHPPSGLKPRYDVYPLTPALSLKAGVSDGLLQSSSLKGHQSDNG